jgi:polar amino acid transport system permease protein
MDWVFIRKHWILYAEAIGLTLRLCFFGTLCSLTIGAFCALVRYYRVPALRRVAGAYIAISRNTPLMIQLFFLYFGLSRVGIRFEGALCAVIGLSFLGGSYMAEAFRGGLEAVGKNQIESGLSIGLSRFQLVRYIIAPQALEIAMPALGANVLFLLKETSVVSIIALADPVAVAKDLIGMYYKTTESLAMLTLGYLLLLLPFAILSRVLEKRLRYAGLGN